MKKQVLLIFFLSVSSIHLLWANDAIVINEKFQDTPLKEVFQLFKQKYQLKIAFADKVVRDVNITAAIHNLSVENTFDMLLRDTELTFELVTNNAIIIKKNRFLVTKTSEFELNAIVRDAISGERLPYAYVWVSPDGLGLTSNIEGYFSIPKVDSSTQLRIANLGYRDTLFTVSEAYKNKRIQINLTPITTELKEVVVMFKDVPEKDFQVEDFPGKLTINPSITSIAPGSGEQDIFRTLQLLPGVNATNEVSSGLNINGGTSNQNLVQFDGFTVYHVDHFFGYFSAFNPLSIKSLQLYKGGFEAKYGGRVSGVVDITGKEGNRNQTSGTLGINLLSVNSSLEIPLSDNGTTLFFSGRRSYTDIWSSSLFEDIFSIFESSLSETTSSDPLLPPGSTLRSSIVPDFYYTDMNLKLSTRIGAKNRLSFSFYDSNDILNYNQTSGVTFRDNSTIDTEELGFITWGNVGSSLKFSRQWSSNHYSNALLSYSFYESNFKEQATSTSTSSTEGTSVSASDQDQNNNIQDFTFRMDHEWYVGSSKIETGITTSLFDTQLKYDVQDSAIVQDVKKNKLLVAHYLQGTFSPTPDLFVTPGFRSSYLGINSRFYADPRLSLSYTVNKRWSINVATGIYHQFINQSNTDNVLEGSRDFWVLADDEEVPVQKAWHGLVGAEFSNGQTNVAVNFFQKNFDGLMEYAFSNGNLLTEFDNLDQTFAIGEGKSYGMDVLFKHRFGRLNSWLTYNLQWVEQTFPDINQGNTFYADYDQRHELNWLAYYSVGPFQFSASWIYGSGRPFSNPVPSESSGSFQNRGRLQPSFIQFEGRNTERLPIYHRLDVSADFNLSLGTAESTISVSVFNLYDRTNILDKQVSLITPPTRGNRSPILSSQDVALMGITPNISFMIKF